MAAVTEEERPRGYSLQEHVDEADVDRDRESINIRAENRELKVRVDDLETALRQIRELTGQDWPEVTVGKITEVVDEVLGPE